MPKQTLQQKIRHALGRFTAKRIAMILLGTAILSFGIHNIHQRTAITEGGIIGLVLLINHWLGVPASVASPLLDAAEAQLREYFAGTRRTFDLPLAPRGTAFQQRVWAALRAIPYGETRTYGELAAAIGSPSASRAVGMANHHNPIPIVIPCHRVIGANGTLTGYTGGLEIKRKLLALEGITILK